MIPQEVTSERITPIQSPQAGRPRLHFLDGIRGVAALLVVCHHLWQHSLLSTDGSGHPLWFRALSILKFGHFCVAVFIVLSGFCLMLPVAQAQGVIKGGVGNYLKRRSRRILPPYYAALILAAAITFLIPASHVVLGTIYDPYSRNDMTGAVVSHLLLIHNLNPNWIFRFNGPLWSVATEWQIYFLFPALLLPAWRRWGSAAPIALGLIGGGATAFTFLSEACFWYVGLFAMGMAACALCYPDGDKARLWSPKQLVSAYAALTLCLVIISHGRYQILQPCFDILIGAYTAALLVYCTRQSSIVGAPQSVLVRFLSSRPLMELGIFSYSLYLVHFPLIMLGRAFLQTRHFSDSTNFLIFISIGLPVILVASYLFHRLFERPFMHISRK